MQLSYANYYHPCRWIGSKYHFHSSVNQWYKNGATIIGKFDYRFLLIIDLQQRSGFDYVNLFVSLLNNRTVYDTSNVSSLFFYSFLVFSIIILISWWSA